MKRIPQNTIKDIATIADEARRAGFAEYYVYLLPDGNFKMIGKPKNIKDLLALVYVGRAARN